MSVDFIALIINGLVTGISGVYIIYSIYLGKFEKHLFYYLFGIGFIIYGVQIFARASYLSGFFSSLMFCSSALLFAVGLWSLSHKSIFSAIIFIVYSLVFSLMFFWKLNLAPDFLVKFSLLIGSTLVHIPLIMLIAYHRIYFGKIADKFVFGWTLLFLANFATFGMGWITDFFAIFSKLILLLGIKDYDFLILTQRIRGEIAVKYLPTDTGHGKEGGLKLILPSRYSSYITQVDWMERAILENVKKGITTFVFTFQDVVPHKELRRMKWINPEKVFIFLFSSSAEKAKKEFTVLQMGITQIGAALSEVVKKLLNSEEGCMIFLIDLSLLIHVFGAHPVYYLLLNKMGLLREGKADLFAFFHPETHSDKSIVSLFTNIADEVIKL